MGEWNEVVAIEEINTSLRLRLDQKNTKYVYFLVCGLLGAEYTTLRPFWDQVLYLRYTWSETSNYFLRGKIRKKENILAKYNIGKQKEREYKLVEFYAKNKVAIEKTLFQNQKR